MTQALATRTIFDDDADTTNNGISWNASTGRLNSGSFGVATAGTLAVKVTGPGAGATPTYLTVTAADLAAFLPATLSPVSGTL